jgi:hypothetical protein
MVLAERLFRFSRRNRDWLDSIQPPSAELARIDAEIEALRASLPKRPVNS